MDPVLLGRTVRFQPCLWGKQERHGEAKPLHDDGRGHGGAHYLENGSDFPTGKPLPCVLVSTLPQCTATWQSFSSTSRQYSCCGHNRGVSEHGGWSGGLVNPRD